MRQHKWSHPVTPRDARSRGIQWSHVTQGHMTQGKGMETEIVSRNWYIKLKTPSQSPNTSALLMVLLMSSSGCTSSARCSGDFCQEVCLYLSCVCDLSLDDHDFIHVPHSTFFLELLNFFVQPLRTLVQGENQKLLSRTQQAQKTQKVDNPHGSSQGEVDLGCTGPRN